MDAKVPRSKPTETTGYTLIELLIVVVILSTLASIVMPRLFSKTDESKVIVAITTVKNVQKKIQSYHLLNGQWPTEIDRAWFTTKKYPRSPFYPNFDGPTANIQNLGDKWHPEYKTIERYPPFWYNIDNGSFRIRVPSQATDEETIELYNRVNTSAVIGFRDFADEN